MPLPRILAACAAMLVFGAAPGGASTFSILTTYVPGGQLVAGRDGAQRTSVGFSDRQQQLLGMAGTFWTSALTGFSGLGNATLSLTASMAPVDGRYRVAAFAGPKIGQWVNGADPTDGSARRFLRPVEGAMQFDADDFGAPSPDRDWEETFLSVAIHEIAHVLGYGTAFSANGLLDETGRGYVGRQAVAAFNRTHGTSVSRIALDEKGQHWSECWVIGGGCAAQDGSGHAGQTNDSDVLTPYVSAGHSTIAPASIAMFRDMGYLTVDPFADVAIPSVSPMSPVPLPAGGLLLASGLVGVGVLRRRRG